MLHVHEGINATTGKVAAFDLDWTLIRPVHARFPKDGNDYAFLPNRVETLKLYANSGYTLAIFTNQGHSGIKLTQALERITNVVRDLAVVGVHPWVFAATGRGSTYRKPSTAMWQEFMKRGTFTEAFYCGDAAGRPTDHSDDDLMFAANVGLTFLTPEQVFPSVTVDIPQTQTMFIFVGMPGSGKTTFYETNLLPRHWVHANQDTLKTHAKVLNAVEVALSQGKSVAVDGTNPTIAKRRDFIMLAAKYRIPTMILYFVGNGYGRNALRANKVPDIAYNMYFKNLEEPSIVHDGVPVLEIE